MYVGQPPSLLDAVVGVDDAISLARQKHERGNSRGGALRIQGRVYATAKHMWGARSA